MLNLSRQHGNGVHGSTLMQLPEDSAAAIVNSPTGRKKIHENRCALASGRVVDDHAAWRKSAGCSMLAQGG
jgi:hypothetical protein